MTSIQKYLIPSVLHLISLFITDIEAFPEIHKERLDSPSETRKSRKPQVYNHETEIIFALPALYMNLKSMHFQSKHEPQQDGMGEYVYAHTCMCLLVD